MSKIPSMEELWNRQEELHPDLHGWMSEVRRLGLCLRHPLVYEVPYFPQMNAVINARYLQKVEMVQTATKEERWSKVVWLHEKPWRLQAFSELEEKVSDEDYWDLLAEIWVNSENIWQHISEWRRFLSSARPGSFMDGDDLRRFNVLPDVVTCYRGYEKGKNFDGLSYTLSYDKAEWFAHRFAKGNRAAVRQRQVPKEKVFAFTDRRNEQEIIVL